MNEKAYLKLLAMVTPIIAKKAIAEIANGRTKLQTTGAVQVHRRGVHQKI